MDTGTGRSGKFGTTRILVPAVPVQTFIPVLDTSVSSVQRLFSATSTPVPDTLVNAVHQYRYRTLRQARYDIHAGTEHTGTVPNTPLTYTRYIYISEILVHFRSYIFVRAPFAQMLKEPRHRKAVRTQNSRRGSGAIRAVTRH